MPGKYQKKTNNPNMGAPIKEIDFTLFENLCSIQCTLNEISGIFRVSEDTIERRCKEHYDMTFADIFKRFSSNGKASLRRTQFRMAETNPAMAIFLGKVHLGQREAQYIEQVVTGSMTSNLNLKSLTTEELVSLNLLLKKAETPS